MTSYPVEVLDPYKYDDNGTMPQNVAALSAGVVGRRIVSAERGRVKYARINYDNGLILTLDDGRKVTLVDESDCCAYTELKSFLLHPENVDHVITGVGTTDAYTKWHIYADMGDVLELTVEWSAGNAFYYAYGFDITVIDPAVTETGK